MTQLIQDLPELEDRPPAAAPERPTGGYALLLAVFTALAGAFSAWFRASGRELPERMQAGDLALVTVATHKASRLLTKDRVTSPVRAPFIRFEDEAAPTGVRETADGEGLRRAIGELLVCPYCLGMWIGAAFAAGLLVAPRFTRWFAAVLTAVFGADVLQIAYKKAEDAR
jgi:hypothetical protein